MPFSPEETQRPCLHQRTPPLLQAHRPAARATCIGGSFSAKTNATGSGGGSSSAEAQGARELLFKVGGEVNIRGGPYAPFVDTVSFAGIVKGFSSSGGYMVADVASRRMAPRNIDPERIPARQVDPMGEL